RSAQLSPGSDYPARLHAISCAETFGPDPATPQTHPLSLHDALPISPVKSSSPASRPTARRREASALSWLAHSASTAASAAPPARSEEHTSELQSQSNLVCRLLLGKKNWHDRPRLPRLLRYSLTRCTR